MHGRDSTGVRLHAWAVLAVVTAVVAAGCGGGSDDIDPGAGNPEPAAVDSKALAGAPPKLRVLYEGANELRGGGLEAFERELARLRGYPVVVNKWASWCGPCRFEFPFFQEIAAERGTEVAFLGIDTDDSEEAARTFLEELPLPYPSFSDPEAEIARALDADREFPATAFLDRRGDVVYVHRGVYASKDDLAADVERHAR